MNRRNFLSGIGAFVAGLAGLAVLPAVLPSEAMPTLYEVGSRGGYATVQEAFDALYRDRGAVAFSTDYPDIGAWPSCS